MKWVAVNKLLLAVSHYFTDKLHKLTTFDTCWPMSASYLLSVLAPYSGLFFVSLRPSLFATVCSPYDAVGSFWVDVMGIWSHAFLDVIVRFTLHSPHAEMHQHSSDSECLKRGREPLISLKSGMLSSVCWLSLSSSFFSLLDTWDMNMVPIGVLRPSVFCFFLISP